MGIDPDTDRTPVEGVALRRLKHGGLRSENLVDDALTIAIAETGVPLIAFDAERVDGDLGLRLARSGESLGEARPLSARQLVIADGERPVAVVLGEVGVDAGVTPEHRADDRLRPGREGSAAHQPGGSAVVRGRDALHLSGRA